MYGRLSREKRAQIQSFKQQKYSMKKIAIIVGCSRATVALWCKKSFGFVDDDKRTGRKKKVTERTKRHIIRLDYQQELL